MTGTIPDGREDAAGSLLLRLQERHPFPLSALVSLTDRCNLRCGHCFLPPGAASASGELSLDEVRGLLDQLAEMGTLLLSLTGGEPALRPDLERIVAAAVDRRFAVKLKSNGTLLDGARIRALAAAGLGELHVSLYDDRPAEHDAFVGMDGAFERSVRALELARDLGIRVQAAISALHRNAERVPALIDLCEARGLRYVVDVRVAIRADGDRAPATHRPSEEQIAAVLSDPRILDAPAYVACPDRTPGDGLCAAGTGTVWIDPRGRVGLCPFLPVDLGDIRERPLADLWRGSGERQRFLALTWADLPECSACDIAWACVRCPGAALLETGDLLGPSPADCAAARARARVCAAAREAGHGR